MHPFVNSLCCISSANTLEDPRFEATCRSLPRDLQSHVLTFSRAVLIMGFVGYIVKLIHIPLK